MQERTEWASGISFVAIGVLVGIGGIVLVRFTELPKEPWLYVSLTVGLVSALGGLILAMIRARELSD
jgi:hypothetical protein